MEINSDPESVRLYQQQNQRLQLENKTMKLRVQGVQVLGKVLQESEEENSQLKQEVIELKEQLQHAGINISDMQSLSSQPGTLSPQQPQQGTLSPQQPPTGASLPGQQQTEQMARCYLSKAGDKSVNVPASFEMQGYEYVNFDTGDSSMSMMSSLAMGGDLHIKELKSGFRSLKEVTENLIQQTTETLNKLRKSEEREGDAELKVKLTRLLSRLETHEKEAKTRESLLWGLATQEEQLKEKFMAIETEQVSQEKVMTELTKQIGDEKEELERVKDEINFMNEAVLVRREDVPSPSTMSSSCTLASQESSNQAENAKAEQTVREGHVMTGSVTANACTKCTQYLEQLKDLQQLLEQTKNERNEAVRLKEEILDVNHAWDAQYKKLEAETTKQIDEQNTQLEILKSGDKQKRFDKLWMTAKSMIDEEKAEKQNVLRQNKILEERCKHFEDECVKLADELEERKKGMIILEAKLREQLASKPSGWNDAERFGAQQFGMQMPQQQIAGVPLPSPPFSICETSLPPASITREASADMINEIEVLKQQLRVYADDFTSERQDRERIQGEKEKLSDELKAVKEQVLALEAQLRVYEEDFQRERQENEQMRRQLQSVNRAPYANAEAEMSRKAQAVAEQQARLRALREQYNQEERRLLQEEQELHQATARPTQTKYNSSYPPYGSPTRRAYGSPWQQQPLRARGPTDLSARHVDEMFHGGEVQPDRGMGREVVDSPDQDHAADEINCPRCLRPFPQGDQEALNKHIDRCIEP